MERSDAQDVGDGPEIVERDNARDDESECGGDLRIAGVRHVLFAVDQIAMNFRVKRIAYVGDITGKLDHISAGANLDFGKSVSGQPLSDSLNIGISGAKLLAELVRSQPSVVIGRRFVLLFFEELLKGNLLFRAALHEQKHSLQRLRVGNGALVELRASEGVHVPRQRKEVLFVNGLGNARGNVRGLSVHAATGDS